MLVDRLYFHGGLLLFYALMSSSLSRTISNFVREISTGRVDRKDVPSWILTAHYVVSLFDLGYWAYFLGSVVLVYSAMYPQLFLRLLKGPQASIDRRTAPITARNAGRSGGSLLQSADSVLVDVFTRLQRIDLNACLLVCRAWHRIIDESGPCLPLMRAKITLTNSLDFAKYEITVPGVLGTVCGYFFWRMRRRDARYFNRLCAKVSVEPMLSNWAEDGDHRLWTTGELLHSFQQLLRSYRLDVKFPTLSCRAAVDDASRVFNFIDAHGVDRLSVMCYVKPVPDMNHWYITYFTASFERRLRKLCLEHQYDDKKINSQFVAATMEYVVGRTVFAPVEGPLFPDGLVLKCPTLPAGLITRLMKLYASPLNTCRVNSVELRLPASDHWHFWPDVYPQYCSMIPFSGEPIAGGSAEPSCSVGLLYKKELNRCSFKFVHLISP